MWRRPWWKPGEKYAMRADWWCSRSWRPSSFRWPSPKQTSQRPSHLMSPMKIASHSNPNTAPNRRNPALTQPSHVILQQGIATAAEKSTSRIKRSAPWSMEGFGGRWNLKNHSKTHRKFTVNSKHTQVATPRPCNTSSGWSHIPGFSQTFQQSVRTVTLNANSLGTQTNPINTGKSWRIAHQHQ